MANVMKNTGTNVCNIYTYSRFTPNIKLDLIYKTKLVKKAAKKQKRDSINYLFSYGFI